MEVWLIWVEGSHSLIVRLKIHQRSEKHASLKQFGESSPIINSLVSARLLLL